MCSLSTAVSSALSPGILDQSALLSQPLPARDISCQPTRRSDFLLKYQPSPVVHQRPFYNSHHPLFPESSPSLSRRPRSFFFFASDHPWNPRIISSSFRSLPGSCHDSPWFPRCILTHSYPLGHACIFSFPRAIVNVVIRGTYNNSFSLL